MGTNGFLSAPQPEQQLMEPCVAASLVAPLAQVIVENARAAGEVSTGRPFGDAERVPLRHVRQVLEAQFFRTGRKDSGLRASLLSEPSQFGVAYYAAHSAPTVGDALRVFARCFRLVHEAADFELELVDEKACLNLRTHAGGGAELGDFLVCAVACIVRRWLPPCAHLDACFERRAPLPFGRDQAILPAGITARTRWPYDALLLDAELLTQPLASADAGLHAILLAHADGLLARAPIARNFAELVRSETRKLLRDGELSGTRLATRLGMSRRTMSRHLARETTSFSVLLEGVRHDTAVELLGRSDTSIHEISLKLGYSLPAAFSRAFRRWEGMSPIEFRRRACAESGTQLRRAAL